MTVYDNGCGIREEDLVILKNSLEDPISSATTTNSSGICLGLRMVTAL